MLDLRRVRDDPETARARMSVREDGQAIELLDRALERDAERRRLIAEVEELKAARNRVSRKIGELKRKGEEAADRVREMQGTAARIRELDDQLAGVERSLGEALLRIPNFPDERVPPGSEGEAEVVREWGEPTGAATRPHWEIGPKIGLASADSRSRYGDGAAPVLDLERASKISGAGFPLLIGVGAELNRALIRFMLELHVREHGYLEIAPPLLVSRDSMTATGHLPKFEEDAYRTEPDDLFLVPTAEVPLTNLHRDEILAGESLPLAYVAHTPCFRREAGAAGRETRGLLRVHQFDKVELVRFCEEDASVEELEALTRHAETVLERLELPYRRVLLPGGDLGFANAITYDLEIWSPGVQEWLEISSCSSYTDYQARRANIRYRPEPGAGPRFVHSLNGSGLALARLIVGLLENGYREGEGVVLPPTLRPYLGVERIEELP